MSAAHLLHPTRRIRTDLMRSVCVLLPAADAMYALSARAPPLLSMLWLTSSRPTRTPARRSVGRNDWKCASDKPQPATHKRDTVPNSASLARHAALEAANRFPDKSTSVSEAASATSALTAASSRADRTSSVDVACQSRVRVAGPASAPAGAVPHVRGEAYARAYLRASMPHHPAQGHCRGSRRTRCLVPPAADLVDGCAAHAPCDYTSGPAPAPGCAQAYGMGRLRYWCTWRPHGPRGAYKAGSAPTTPCTPRCCPVALQMLSPNVLRRPRQVPAREIPDAGTRAGEW